MHPIHAQLLGLTPLKLKAKYNTHADTESVQNTSVPLILPVRLAEDIALAINIDNLVVMSGESISLQGNTLTLPDSVLSTEQKQQLWRVIYHAVSA
ncbi:hypothetical protein [Pseudoalteromonas luteoviolacea]|uniref:Uncharacterized protein n=1 Tax=Pseudoalteromonas luteoviolacea S4054 TaxID=1129367 RepID=A0A0F6A7N4_9GAMM|nr:hypothetical protein [Pseudoalteromonas luteoviolacea]AOT06784.1 hypothetical protein S4054249_02345 [Pseudoalteromonas luteoviolacea]AOT11702.1 hypothetical protein S40542_02345 [Pseudoalteromonas luteoviolacea]AOT16614.1 hypothetical protein S4054_02345 [Pseudoalteromonas luteoviolacea]KKE82138.1 hypothetical protein N479_19680 [Pseudoalteromonas luteoviolacea S4054]KZN74112.1 hypothetical protein N481_10390 [Pseudoalteromonas luteoviolacea S4047-1]